MSSTARTTSTTRTRGTVRALGVLAALPLATVLLTGTASAATATSTANPYAPTSSTASGNGNGNGAATGKPAAGSVGNADSKNPKGQAPGGSDHDNGYECDGNSGVGRSNPAHTSCTSTAPEPVVEDSPVY